MAIGQFGPALEEALKRTGNTREQAGAVAHVDASLIGKIVKGSRNPSKELMAATADYYDDGELFLGAAAEVTGGAFIPWLNAADLHTSTTTLKTLEEIEEAQLALHQAPITKRRDQLSDKDRQKIEISIKEQIEAVTALLHNITMLCRSYDFSFAAMFRAHRAEMKSKNYMK
ncbi:XRE family transcriptional regulator [Paenibacillus sp. SN-8-1]|uniref:XRE family transcriptional regulator n=1 Tax=Paenibacillus sp. SN-8-1 TaxID=3435409 RepID=UPI003D9A2548